MKDRKLATRYARALLASLPDASARDLAGQVLEGLAAALDADPALKNSLIDPATPASTRSQGLEAVAVSQGAPKELANFLATVVAHGRVAMLPAMSQVFREERERAQGVVSGTLTTAAPIGTEQAARAAAALSRLSGRKVQLELRVDPDLLGGGIAQVGSMVYDGSMRSQLVRLSAKVGEE